MSAHQPAAESFINSYNTEGNWPCSSPLGKQLPSFHIPGQLFLSPLLLLFKVGWWAEAAHRRLHWLEAESFGCNTSRNLALLITSRQTTSQVPHPRSIPTGPPFIVVLCLVVGRSCSSAASESFASAAQRLGKLALLISRWLVMLAAL